MKYRKTILLTLMVVAVYVLHQDFWNWKQAEPLVFGFLPIGLAYQGYSILAAIMMAVLVRFAWPKHLEPGARTFLSASGTQSPDGGQECPRSEADPKDPKRP